MAFAQVYICPTHGEVINVHIQEDIDVEGDEIYYTPVCNLCFRVVQPLNNEEGKPVWRPLTEEEMFWDNFSLDEEDEDYDEY